MSDAFKDVSTVPTLTLEPFQAEEEKKPAVQPEEPKLDDTILTEEERRMVDAFAQQIDLTNSSMILQYGAGTQKKMADFSESALENVKSKDLGEVGALLTNVVTELKSFDEEESKGFLGIFKKASNKVESMKAKYSKAEENVNQIVKALDNHQVQLLKDSAMRQPHTLQTHTHCGSSKKRWEVFDLFSGSPLRAPCHPCRPYQYPKGADRTGNCPDAQTTAPSHCHSQNM